MRRDAQDGTKTRGEHCHLAIRLACIVKSDFRGGERRKSTERFTHETKKKEGKVTGGKYTMRLTVTFGRENFYTWKRGYVYEGEIRH